MTAILPRYAWAVSAERFLNSYHNASTPPGPDVPAELAAFMLAVDPVLIQAAELASGVEVGRERILSTGRALVMSI